MKGSNIIFITFDDGPEPGITEFIIETLEKYDAKATFFCCGNNVEKYPELMRLLRSKGHSVGNHTYSHLNGLKNDSDSYFNDVNRCDEVTGECILFRPPWGLIRFKQLFALRKRKKIMLWDVASGDTNSNFKTEELLVYWLHKVRKNSVVLFHFSEDLSSNTRILLPLFLRTFKEHGYEFRKTPG